MTSNITSQSGPKEPDAYSQTRHFPPADSAAKEHVKELLFSDRVPCKAVSAQLPQTPPSLTGKLFKVILAFERG